jgi:WD40 repeat protein
MNAFLSFLERLLIGIFALGFGVLAIIAATRYYSGSADEGDPWRRVRKQNTIEAYLGYLRECQSCRREGEAEKALDELQRERGLVSRLDQAHLPERASIGLPAFSPDGRTVLASGGAGPDFWDADTGKHLFRGEQAFRNHGGRAVEALAYSPDGHKVAAGTAGMEGGRLLVWDEATGTAVGEQFVEGFDVKAVQFAPQGFLLGWLAQGPVGIWEPATGKFLRSTHEGAGSLAFFRNENGQTFLLTASGKEVWSWDPATMELARQVRFNTDRPLLGLSRDGRAIAFSDGRVLELWDTRTALQIASLRDLNGEIVSFCREPVRGWLAVGTRTGLLYLWDPAGSSLPLGHVAAHEGPVEQVACSAQGRAVTVSWDSAKVWNLERVVKTEKLQTPAKPRG